VIVLATGFEAIDLPIANVIYGRGGLRLADAWADRPRAFACTTISGFPNLFMMLGPNTGLGAGSMVYMAETQTNYIREALNYLLGQGVVIEPTAQAERDYVDRLDARSQGTVWVAGGCKSWYLHPSSGKLTALWPDFMRQFRAENGTFSEKGYGVRRVGQSVRQC
jgi:cation diffusion facilitator CzcD-associated flavoprotein CzcO